MTAQEEVSAWQTVNQSTLVVILASELDGFSQATFSLSLTLFVCFPLIMGII